MFNPFITQSVKFSCKCQPESIVQRWPWLHLQHHTSSLALLSALVLFLKSLLWVVRCQLPFLQIIFSHPPSERFFQFCLTLDMGIFFYAFFYLDLYSSLCDLHHVWTWVGRCCSRVWVQIKGNTKLAATCYHATKPNKKKQSEAGKEKEHRQE